MDLEERIREVEQTLAFLKGGLVVGLGAAIVYFGVTTFWQIPERVKTEMAIYIGEETQETIDDALTKANTLLDHEGLSIWPDGTYAILKSGDCPKGFEEREGKITTIETNYVTERYLTPQKFGDSQISKHPQGDWADLRLVACVKTQ